jgi:hypothetical protein
MQAVRRSQEVVNAQHGLGSHDRVRNELHERR